MTDYKDLFNRLEKLGISVESKIEAVEAFSSGIWIVDKLTGINGYPVGRIIELFGEEMSGKSYLALRAIGSMQKLIEGGKFSGKCAYLDLEKSFDPVWASRVGVNVKNLLIIRPQDSAEKALEAVCILTEYSPLIVIDSTAALIPKDELEGTIEDTNVGLLARVLSKALRVLVQSASVNKCTIIFINQLREKIAMGGRPIFGDSTDTPGGRALKFYSSVRLRVSRRSTIKSENTSDTKVVGHLMEIKIVKNKCGCPMGNITLPFYYASGLDEATGIIELALEKGIIKRSGSKYTYNNKSWIGYNSVVSEINIEELKNDIEKLGAI